MFSFVFFKEGNICKFFVTNITFVRFFAGMNPKIYTLLKYIHKLVKYIHKLVKYIHKLVKYIHKLVKYIHSAKQNTIQIFYSISVNFWIMNLDSCAERFFKNQVFTLYIGTMPRFVQIETCFFGIIHCMFISDNSFMFICENPYAQIVFHFFQFVWFFFRTGCV